MAICPGIMYQKQREGVRLDLRAFASIVSALLKEKEFSGW